MATLRVQGIFPLTLTLSPGLPKARGIVVLPFSFGVSGGEGFLLKISKIVDNEESLPYEIP